jgi:hypothetical protein
MKMLLSPERARHPSAVGESATMARTVTGTGPASSAGAPETRSGETDRNFGQIGVKTPLKKNIR